MTNSDSRVIAAGLLIDGVKALSNLATPGERTTSESGWQERWYAKKKKNWRGVTRTSQGVDGNNYAPTAQVETIDTLFISSDALDNQGGTLLGKQVQLQVRNDLNNVGGVIQAEDKLTALAGGQQRHQPDRKPGD
ncbi:hypothetical protein ABRP59_02175 [Pectobacterium punjabense]|uniref:hypothetical protein n=1 Tax=Pectobacterium punjabense TaxID=2108399 RepID=UPI0032EE181A